jgi:hypothetical protein
VRHFYAGGAFTHAITHLSDTTLRTYGGLLTSPAQGNDPRKAVERGMVWGVDNDCFVRYDPAAILKALDKWRGIPGCVFATVPDVVRNHAETLLLFRAWIGTYQRYGFPPAFVLQNGVTLAEVPFASIAAVFIGGDDLFKKSETVAAIVAEAQRRGLWSHAGRVNGRHRINDALRLNCDSFDGTGYSIEPNRIFEALPQLLSPAPAPFPVQMTLMKVG